MRLTILAALFLSIAFIPHLNFRKLYLRWIELLKNIIPEVFPALDQAFQKAGLSKKWKDALLFFISLSTPVGIFYLMVAHIQDGIHLRDMSNYILISFSPFVGYGLVVFIGKRRHQRLSNDIRQIYRSLRLVLRSGGTCENAIRKSVNYTTVLKPYLEGLLVNWGSADYELLKIRDTFKTVPVESLVAYLIELKNGINQTLIENVERQERFLSDELTRGVERDNEIVEKVTQGSFILFLFAQFYLFGMPLFEYSMQVFRTM